MEEKNIMTVAIGEDVTGRRFAIPELHKVSAAVFPGSDSSLKEPLHSQLPREIATGYSWANWGDYDNLPNEWEEKIKDSPTASQAIVKNTLSIISDGLVYCSLAQKNLKQSEREEITKSDIEEFLMTNDINYQLLEVVTQFFTFGQYFVFYTLNNAKNKIAYIQVKPAAFVRKTKQNLATFWTDFLLYSEKFGSKFGYPQKQEITPVPLLNRFQFNFFEQLKGFRFARHIAFPLTSFHYYATPPWAGLFKKNGWVDVGSKVPVQIGAMQDNQLRVIYMIRISEDYFKMRYVNLENPQENWATMNPNTRSLVIANKFKEIEDNLTKPENTGKSISYVFEQDRINPAIERGHIQIEAIDNKVKAGDWLPDISQADLQVVLGMGVSGSMYGLQPQGGKMGAGSGSDKMQDRNINISTNTIIQQTVLDWLNYVAIFNKWDVYFYFRDLSLTTKDKSQNGIIP